MTKLTLARDHTEGELRPQGAADTSELWGEYLRRGARDHRDRLVLHYTALVRQVAGRVGTRLPAHVELSDLTQAGVFGLMDAIERFEPELGIRFEVYAAQRIRGAILDELRAQDWVPRIVRSRAREVAKARETVEARLHRRAKPSELADELGLGPAEVRGVLDQIQLISTEALDEWAWARGITISIAESVAEEDSDPVALLEERETSELLARSLSQLSERDHRVLWLSYVENRTLAEIGHELGVTESRACQLRGRAVTRLRERFADLAGSADTVRESSGKIRRSGAAAPPAGRGQPVGGSRQLVGGQARSDACACRPVDGQDRSDAGPNQQVGGFARAHAFPSQPVGSAQPVGAPAQPGDGSETQGSRRTRARRTSSSGSR